MHFLPKRALVPYIANHLAMGTLLCYWNWTRVQINSLASQNCKENESDKSEMPKVLYKHLPLLFWMRLVNRKDLSMGSGISLDNCESTEDLALLMPPSGGRLTVSSARKIAGILFKLELVVTGEISTTTSFSTSSGWNMYHSYIMLLNHTSHKLYSHISG